MSTEPDEQQGEQALTDEAVADLAPTAEDQANTGGGLSIDGIKGESQESDHKDWIE